MKLFPAFNPRWAQGLVRALDMKGDYPSGVSAPYQPSINVCDLDAPEFAFLRGDRLLEGVNGTLGDATHVPVVTLWNPNSAEVMLIVDSVEVTTDAGQDVALYLGGDLAGGVGFATLVARDARIQARNTTWGTKAVNNSLLPGSIPATAQRNRQAKIIAGTTYRFDGPWILTPFNVVTGLPAAQTLNVFGTIVATLLLVSFKCRERRWEKAER